MTHTLISFLGKAGNYQSTAYQFPDGEIATTRYFGLALRRKLQADHLVMFGTSGSAWDVICLILAHGAPPKRKSLWKKLKPIVGDSNLLQQELQRLIKKLLPRLRVAP